MYSKVNYTIVGVFVLLFTAGMVWFGFWLAKYGLQETYSTYKLEMKDSVAGLSKDSNVQLHGVTVGRVSKIRIDPKNIEVTEILLEIREEIPIKEDMVASTHMMGVTGLLSIEIEGGSNTAKTLVPSETYIPLIKSKPSLLSKLTNTLDGLSGKLEKLLTQSDKLLSDKNIEHVGTILSNIEKITAKGEALEESTMASLEEFRTSMAEINKKFAQATADFKVMQKDFSEIKGVTVPTVDKLMATTKDFQRVTLKFERSLDRGDYSLKKILGPAVIDVQILSKELSAISRQFGQNPNELLFKSRKARRGPGE